jgi:Fic family protein
MTESMFRIKKGRTQKTETIGGTLDSVHQSVISSLHDSHDNQKNLKELITELDKEINQTNPDDILNLAQKHDKLRTLQLQ